MRIRTTSVVILTDSGQLFQKSGSFLICYEHSKENKDLRQLVAEVKEKC